MRRLSADPDRPVVEALLDQKDLAGIGNLWAVETCYLRGISPWTPVRDVDLRAAVRLARRMMRHSLEHPGQVTTGDTRRGHDALGLRAGRAAVPAVRHTGGVPRQRDRAAVRARDLVVPVLPARAVPDARAAADAAGPAPGRERGVVRLADQADVGATGVRAAERLSRRA